MTINVAVTGATGRMGRVIVDLIESTDELALHAALDSSSSLSSRSAPFRLRSHTGST
jgi:4-hydroxy-tetrahydrodipicolinate reductase